MFRRSLHSASSWCTTAHNLLASARLHRAALAAGGRDNGPPGTRPYGENYYAAFVLDPDGHNIEAVRQGA